MDSTAVGRRVTLAVAVLVEMALLAAAGTVAGCQSTGDSTGPRGPDYVDIATVVDGPPDPAPVAGAATGSYTWSCGENRDGHYNSANIVIAPGIVGTAHHTHDYVGNLSTVASSTDASLAAAGTTCANGDESTYYWPVLRVTDGRSEDGAIQVPTSVTLTFSGSPVGPVLAMPRFLRAVTGDARAFTSSPALVRPVWTCSSTPLRRTTKYPRCPAGDQVVRVFDFPSCWDGRRTDSPDHRSHLLFPDPAGACPHGTFAVPRLRIRVAYALPSGARYAIDAFPDQHNSPLTDHALFVSILPDSLTAEVVRCLNAGRTCGTPR
jgi:hypothetical protein